MYIIYAPQVKYKFSDTCRMYAIILNYAFKVILDVNMYKQ